MIQSHCYNWPAYKFLKIFCLEKHFVLFHNINFISNLIIQYLQKTYRRFGTKYLSVLNNKDLRCHLRQNDFLGILSSWARCLLGILLTWAFCHDWAKCHLGILTLGILSYLGILSPWAFYHRISCICIC